MGKALEVITGQVTNPGSTDTVVTMNAGDSASPRSANPGSAIHLLQAWAFTTTNLHARIRSPRMHDQAQNMRFQPTASQPYPLLPWAASEPVYSQDNLTIELQGGAAEHDLISLLLYYDDLPGANANLHSPQEVEPLIEHLTVVEVDLTSSATSCNYSGTTALNGTFDNLKRDRQYAILGYECAVTGGTLGFRGSFSSNYRVGGPLMNQSWVTSEWFMRLSNEYGVPCVPVFNASDVAAILLDCACQATSTAFNVGVHLALLGQGANLA